MGKRKRRRTAPKTSPNQHIQQPSPTIRSSDGSAPSGGSVNPDHDFFHKKHLIAAFWTLVGGVIASGVVILYQKVSGPEKVLVANPDTTHRLVIVSDSASREYMAKMLSELRALRAARRSPPSARPASPAAADTSGALALPASGTPNAVKVPAFQLPSVVEGYLGADLRTIATTECPPVKAKPGQDVVVRFHLRTPRDTTRLSPIFVSLTKPYDGNSVLQVFGQQFELRSRSIISLPAPPDTGAYKLEYGVYFTSDLKTKYPPLYRRSCSLRVVGDSTMSSQGHGSQNSPRA